MAKKVFKKIDDLEMAISVIAYEKEDCILATENKAKQPKKMVSCTGGVFFGKKGEQWPTTSEGVPLIPWLQIVCAETKIEYGICYQKKAICFYLQEDTDHVEFLSETDNNNFVVREYGLDDTLVPLKRPAKLKGHEFNRVTWEKQPDYPSFSKYYKLFESDVYDSLCEIKKFKYENNSGIKIGGWPTPLQQEQLYPGAFDLQIDMTDNFMYQDSGIGFLSHNNNQWYLVFESC